MTPQEIELLRAIVREGVVTFPPSAKTAAAAKRFDTLVGGLLTLERCGWIELGVMKSTKTIGGYRQQYAGAAARCRDQGKRALEMIGS